MHMAQQKVLSLDERVHLATTKFQISAWRLEITLWRIRHRLKEHDAHKLAQNKESRTHFSRINAAAQRLYTEIEELPDDAKDLMWSIISPQVIHNIRRTCDLVLDVKPDKPKRDDALEKQVAAREAWRLLEFPETATPEVTELTAILYGTGDPADVESACQTVVKKEISSRPKTRAEREAWNRALIQRVREQSRYRIGVLQRRYPEPTRERSKTSNILSR